MKRMNREEIIVRLREYEPALRRRGVAHAASREDCGPRAWKQ